VCPDMTDKASELQSVCDYLTSTNRGTTSHCVAVFREKPIFKIGIEPQLYKQIAQNEPLK